MQPIDAHLLKQLADRYIWWKTPEEAMRHPQHVIAQVMNMGDYADAQRMAEQLGDDRLRDALVHAEAGQFNPRSWHYWHYRLGLARPGQVPPLPRRTFK